MEGFLFFIGERKKTHAYVIFRAPCRHLRLRSQFFVAISGGYRRRSRARRNAAAVPTIFFGAYMRPTWTGRMRHEWGRPAVHVRAEAVRALCTRPCYVRREIVVIVVAPHLKKNEKKNGAYDSLDYVGLFFPIENITV